MTDLVLIEKSGPVQVIRMNRAEKKNALTPDMYRAMSEALREGDADAAIRVHVFLGVPGAFCAGNDLGDFMAIADGSQQELEVWSFLETLAGSQKPIVSGVDGIAVGLGTTMNLHCDLTFASPRTIFHTPFVDLGVVPEAASSLLAPLVMGRQQAFALLALGEPFPAQRALEAGMIYAVVREEELEAAVMKAANSLASRPPQALRAARDLIMGPRDVVIARIREERDQFMERLRSDEAREILAAFAARRRKPAS